MKDKRKGIKRFNITQLALGFAIIICINIIGAYLFTRLDLTSEKRYSLSPATKKLLKNLDDIVMFKIYLDGDIPAGFKKLRNETKEMLNEFRAYSDNIQYEFIDPSEGKDKKTLQDFYKQLMQKGIVPTNIQVKEKGGAKQQIIFPAAIVTYKGKEMPLQLLMTQYGLAPEAQINSSIQALEFNLANIIKKLSIVRKPKIAFIEGQGELDRYETASISYALSEYYSVDRIKIDHHIKALKDFKLIIIAKPDTAFDEKDKFVIDQFIMKGGKVLWLIDPVFASMDSLRTGTDETMGIGNPLNLDDQLFSYGVRYNYDLLLDLSALQIPVKTGSIGNQPQYGFMPWYFFPLINPVIKHPINNNLNLIKTELVSSLDTLKTRWVKKTILLTTSQFTKRMKTPARISLNIMKQAPDEQEYDKSYLPIGVLLEGEFKSVFVNRIPPEIANDPEIGFKDKSGPNKMIVITDGDIIKNQVQYTNGVNYPYELGYDKYTKETFGNKEFLLNCVDYLCDETGLISVRSRELKIRLLDKTKIIDSKLKWQLINTIIPIVIILLFGIGRSIFRKRKYTFVKK